MAPGKKLERRPKLDGAVQVSLYRPPEGPVVEAGPLAVVLDYPLASPFEFRLEVPAPGWTALELVGEIMAIYAQIYEEEAATSDVAADRAGPGSLNRNETAGTYGIWGHDLADLAIEGFSIGLGTDGVRTVVPSVGS